ncbi:neuronal calcium sensor 2 isoform X4 [Eurytemora carolleeae]|nr:neuronal calcium sensor 2 isoform X4 [Eurytemora carolleeae]|eukprot:XP_023328104.1 neuronal calcium sensor 2-like isoform X4 [Eurytemora affinis]
MGAKGSKERLSKHDIEFLKVNTRYDENTINEWYKGFMADCPDGKLTPISFMQIYSKCFPTGNANEFCDHVFRTFDSDKNGFIDFKEFLLAIDVTSSGSPEEKLNWAFSMYDVDGNGWIDLPEMTKIVKSIYNMMGPQQRAMDTLESPESRAEGIFRRMDINSDGRVTRQEFVRCCLDDQKLIELLTPHST